MILFISRFNSLGTINRFSIHACNFSNKHHKSIIALLLFLFVFSSSSYGQTTGDYRSNKASFNWDVLGSWQIWSGSAWATPTSTQGYPGYSSSPETVTILTGQIVYLTVSPPNSIGNLVIAGTGQLTVNSSTIYTLKIGGNISFGTGTSALNDPLNMKNNSYVGTIELNGTIPQTISGNSTGNCYFSQLNITGTGGVTLNHDIVIESGLTVNTNSTLDISTYLCNKTSSPNCIFSLQSGATFRLSGSTGGESGNNFPIWKSGGTFTYSFDAACTVEYYGATQSISSLPNYGNLKLSGSGIKTLAANVSIAGDLNIGSGTTFDLSTFTANRATSGGTLTVGGTLLLGGVTGGCGNSNFPSLFTTNTLTGTVNYNKSAGGQTIYATPAYNILTLGNTSGIQAAGGNLTATTINNNTNSTDVLNMSTYSLTATIFNNTGTIRTQNTSGAPLPSGINWGGTVQYDATTGGQTVIAGTYGILNNNNTSNINTASGTITATTLNTSSGGTLNMVTFSLGSINITNNGTIRTQSTLATPLPIGKTWSGTVQYDNPTGSQNVMAGTYGILNINNTSSTNTATGDITANTLNITSGGTLNMGANALVLSNVSNAGTISTQNTSTTPISSGLSWGGTVIFNNITSAQTLPASTFNNLTITNNAGVSLASNVLVNGVTLITPSTSRLIIPSTTCLTSQTITPNDNFNQILVKASPLGVGSNGSLIFYNAGTILGTVEMYSIAAATDQTAKTGYKWQFIGIPIKSLSTTSPTFDGGYIRQMHEENNDLTHWVQLNNMSPLTSFTGYEVTQLSARPYVFQGQLENGSHTVNLTYSNKNTYNGENLIGNSYTAAIDISNLSFTGNVINTVYIYNTGSYADWSTQGLGTSDSSATSNTAGKYNAIPIGWAGRAGLQHQIPSMQAFLVIAKGTGATVTIPYSAVGIVANSAAQRSKEMLTKSSSEIIYTIIDVKGSRFSDRMWMFTDPSFTHSFDNGWDGEKFMGSGITPQIYAMEQDGNYQVNSVDDINNTYLGFRAGEDSLYTFTFTHQNLELKYGNVYLVDSVTQQTVDITASGTQYTFLSLPTDTIEKRFKIITNTDISTNVITPVSGSTQLNVFSSKHTVFIDNKSDETGSLYLYDMSGRLIQKYNFTAQGVTTIPTDLPPGNYLVKGITKNRKITKNISL